MTTATLAPHRPAIGAIGAPAIALTGLTKTFGTVQAVRGIDLHVAQGEVLAFLGPNGAGKTTTIDMVLGLAEPTSGSAEVFGFEPGEAIRRGLVSAVMQTGGLLKDLTVRETIAYTASLFPSARPVDEVLAAAGLTDLAGRSVGKCSGGEQQLLRFAMALVSDPQLLILDEPTTGMDVNARRAFWEHIRAEAATGRTIIFATHYLQEADEYADRIVLVRSGRIVADGTPAQLKAQGNGRTVRATWPGVSADDLRDVPGIDHADIRGDILTASATDSDALARHLLLHTPAHDLEVTARGLDEAFIALTATETEEN